MNPAKIAVAKPGEKHPRTGRGKKGVKEEESKLRLPERLAVRDTTAMALVVGLAIG